MNKFQVFYLHSNYPLEKYFVSMKCRNYVDSMEVDTVYGNFMVKLIWRLSGNLIHLVFSMKSSDNLETNFTIKSS